MIQWLGLWAFTIVAQVQSPVRELRSCKLPRKKKKKKKEKETEQNPKQNKTKNPKTVSQAMICSVASFSGVPMKRSMGAVMD